MTGPAVSVIVVSKERPASLRLCLLGLTQLTHQNFEIVVIADQSGLTAIADLGLDDRIKTALFDEPNISRARNLGLSLAAGELVAFIDDDAVPEPTWLSFLTDPFSDPQVGAAGGFVRGRNGISFQWKARWVDRLGQHISLDVPADPSIWSPTEGRAVRTEGTNMAFRRDVIAALGGFDPAYPFFLDDTDLNMRMAAKGVRTAIVPHAEVHHGYAEGPYRQANRVPKSLYQIGASMRVFLDRYAPETERISAWAWFFADQRKRLLQHMVTGGLEPRQVRHLLADLCKGYEDTTSKPAPDLNPIPDSDSAFLRFEIDGMASVTLSGRVWEMSKLKTEAAKRVAHGERVSLFVFSPTTLFHRVRFVEPGFWLQTGGIFGKSDRSQQLFQPLGFKRRLKAETDRIRTQRDIK